jgi:N-acetyl-gamma-glutamyl-phosphate reductase
MVNVTVVGARGYLGREALRLLQNHPLVDRLNAVSLSGADGELSKSVPSFRRADLPLQGPDERVIEGADVIFLATAAGQAKQIAERMAHQHDTMLVDLSRDHRLQALQRQSAAQTAATRQQVAATANGSATTEPAMEGESDAPTQAASWPWTYGLPETILAPKAGDRRIANPGCYPTASLLSLLPAVGAGLAQPGALVVDGKSGVSGAGATPRPDLHYTETNENLHAYKVVGHDHGFEIEAAVKTAADPEASDNRWPVRFTPHLVPMNRGLLATSYIPLIEGVDTEEAREVYYKAYENAATVDIVEEPSTANVRGTVRAEIGVDLDTHTRMLVVRAAIDNLTKGGSGQGVHNMNIALGELPTMGLPLLGGGP